MTTMVVGSNTSGGGGGESTTESSRLLLSSPAVSAAYAIFNDLTYSDDDESDWDGGCAELGVTSGSISSPDTAALLDEIQNAMFPIQQQSTLTAVAAAQQQQQQQQQQSHLMHPLARHESIHSCSDGDEGSYLAYSVTSTLGDDEGSRGAQQAAASANPVAASYGSLDHGGEGPAAPGQKPKSTQAAVIFWPPSSVFDRSSSRSNERAKKPALPPPPSAPPAAASASNQRYRQYQRKTTPPKAGMLRLKPRPHPNQSIPQSAADGSAGHRGQQQQQQQQPQNQMMQQPQQHHTQHQMVQQQQLHQTQQMQALEEQKRRYSMQLQQLQTQQNIQAQQMTRPTSASSHQSLPQQQIAVQQQQQHHPMSRSNSISSQGADRRLSYRIDAETPLSPSMRPPSSRPTSTAPMRPPSRPNSQFSQASAQSLASSHQNVQVFPGGGQSNNSTGSEFPSNTFYNPVSTNRSNQSTSSVAQRGGESTSTPNSAQHVAFNTNVSTYSHPTLPPNSMQHTGHNKTQQLGTSTATKTTADVPSSKSAPNQLQSTTATSTAVSKSGGVRKTAPLRRHSQGTHTSTLTYEEVSNLAKSCTTEQKIVWVARQIFGSGGNGFQKATSAMQRMKRQRARSFKQKKGGGTSVKDVASDFQEAEEKLKLDTFDVRVAKKMQIEMKQGLQFCNLMTDVIGSILEDVDPENPILLVQPPMIGCDDAGLGSEADLFSALPLSLPSSGAVAVDNAGARSTQFSAGTKPGKSLGGRSGSNLPPSSTTPSLDATKGKISSGMKVPMSPSAARKNKAIPAGAEIMAEGNPNGSTLRKLRKRGSTTMPAADVELLKMVGDHDDNGKKLSKKELSYRLFEATRFRSLEVGDYVAAKMASHDLWILARVAKQWNAVATYKQLTGLTEAKRDAIFREKVYIQDNDEYNGDIKSARSVNRQHILPLPRSFSEASDWGFRIRKGFRVYAMYPNTTALYCGSVIDSNTYCRNQDE
mmetsp:Transcript_2240/g.5519  ORF Transcript_2240/g.5519 Transcript_2240/m.5519 type:complete len:982 (-) Transcript_2240:847-3792(-)